MFENIDFLYEARNDTPILTAHRTNVTDIMPVNP